VARDAVRQAALNIYKSAFENNVWRNQLARDAGQTAFEPVTDPKLIEAEIKALDREIVSSDPVLVVPRRRK